MCYFYRGKKSHENGLVVVQDWIKEDLWLGRLGFLIIPFDLPYSFLLIQPGRHASTLRRRRNLLDLQRKICSLRRFRKPGDTHDCNVLTDILDHVLSARRVFQKTQEANAGDPQTFRKPRLCGCGERHEARGGRVGEC